QALRAGASVTSLAAVTGIDPWFIDQLLAIEEMSQRFLGGLPGHQADAAELRAAKAAGFSDAQLGQLMGMDEALVRGLRQALGVRPVYHTVDTCAAEFEARTPYLYSS